MLFILPRIADDFKQIFHEGLPAHKTLVTKKASVINDERLDFFQDIICVDNYETSSELEIEIVKLYEKRPFSKIIISATGESDIIRAASMRRHLAISGQSMESALAFRDKLIMKDIVSSNGIKTPQYKPVECYADLMDFSKACGFPIIVKPRRSKGTIGTKLLTDLNELNAYSKDNFEENYLSGLLAEEYISGSMYHVDGIVIDNHVYCWPSYYIADSLSMINGNYFANQMLSKEHHLFEQLVEFTKRIISILPTPIRTAFHLEVFHKDDQLYFCEIASRVGGGYIEHMWKAAFGQSLRSIFYHLQADLTLPYKIECEEPKIYPASVVIPNKDGVVETIEKNCNLDYVLRYASMAKKGEKTNKSTNTMSAAVSCMLASDSQAQTYLRVQDFLEWTAKNLAYKE